MALRLAVVAAALGSAVAIYPDDHWDYSTKLTNDNFDSEIEKAVNGDYTLMAPSWNDVVKQFKDNDDVQFADVMLSDGGPRGGEGANPGAGGWPTIRYYNKETGVLGKSYDKKTSMPMCDELGPKGEHYMTDYVLEAAGTSLCSIEAPYKGCGEKEKKFIAKVETMSAEDVAKQQTRLTNMKGQKMKAELAQWLNQRLAVLNQFSKKQSASEL